MGHHILIFFVRPVDLLFLLIYDSGTSSRRIFSFKILKKFDKGNEKEK